MKMPIGLLGMTKEEIDDLIRTNKWPERTIEVSDGPPGLSVTGLNDGRAALAREEGKQEGRRETREKIHAAAIRQLKEEQASPGPGRPTSRNDEIKEMLTIIAAYTDKGEKHCRSVFEGQLRDREKGRPRTGEGDGKDWLSRRSKRAWIGAQKALSKA
jgi:hypothetical protein